MGCDAHVAIEYKPYTSPDREVRWDTWAIRLPTSRDYVLFGLLAGVRTRPKDGYEKRGLPQDVSTDVKTWLEESDFHSHSWLTPFEFYSACVKYEQVLKTEGYDDYPLAKEWQSLAELLVVLCKHYGPRNIRIVFAFDS